MLIFSTAHLAGMAHLSAFSPFDIQHGFCIIVDTWYISYDIFTVDMLLSSFAIDRLEPTVQESANEAYQSPSAQIDKLLVHKAPGENVPPGPSASTQPLLSPRQLDEIQVFPKVQPKAVSNK
jgi:hypothetical protein